MLTFLHGFLGVKEDWEGITEHLKAPYRCLTLPGHKGRSLNLNDFEDEIGIFMQNLWPLILANPTPEILHTYLNIIINLLKFNAAYLDTGVVNSFIKGTKKHALK